MGCVLRECSVGLAWMCSANTPNLPLSDGMLRHTGINYLARWWPFIYRGLDGEFEPLSYVVHQWLRCECGRRSPG